MTYGDRPDYWPASANYALAPYGRGVGAHVSSVQIPPELWGDLPGTAVLWREAGQIDPRTLVRSSKLVEGTPPVWADEDIPPPPFVFTPPEIHLPEMTIPGMVPQKPPQVPPAHVDVPPPTTIPETTEPKKEIHPAWIVGGIGAGIVVVGAFVYLATKKTPRRSNPSRRRRRKSPRRSSRRRNPYAQDARGTIHYFPTEPKREKWLDRAPARKSRKVKGTTKRVKRAKKRESVKRHNAHSKVIPW